LRQPRVGVCRSPSWRHAAPETQALLPEVARRLARVDRRIKRVFHGKDQDIEWVYQGGQIYIVQSRPYLAGE